MKNLAMRKNILDLASSLGFGHRNTEQTGYFFQHTVEDIHLIIDTDICNLKNYHYVDYTSRQNRLFHQHETVLRFLFDENQAVEDLEKEIRFFLDGGEDIEIIKRVGRNRSEQDIDPTRPESIFEDCFIEAFGESKRSTLQRESPYVDCDGMTRYIDYALFTRQQKFAVELNGEAFHHPVAIGAKKYRSQLFKQNSLSVDGFKVFRWSENGMRDKENFIQDLRAFFGDSNQFRKRGYLKVDRKVETIQLKDHQEDALQWLEKGREEGRNTFLMVLPTGTGKTEIFIKDIELEKRKFPPLKVLVLVPTKDLRRQTIERFKQRMPQHSSSVGSDLAEHGPPDIVVQTYAYMHRHYSKYDKERFNYIVVDEAHHAVASGLRTMLEYYTPEHLLGVTATPKRFDQKKLEDVFGEYESTLSLEEAIRKGLVPPVSCYRIRSNIDLSEVRFNGKDYVKSDLQTTLRIPSRDDLVAKTLSNYFSGEFAYKQGVVFCVDIKHAKRMAACLNNHEISALAVNGRERKEAEIALDQYRKNKVRFLCACDLLTEGWDAPQTSILVMARPTFSKVLYTQQLGRGLRNYQNKEALYVLDVVDNYGARLQPMSLHALFKIDSYIPFELLVKPEGKERGTELEILDGLFEGVRRIEPVNINNFENLYGDYLNEEQLARELFVSTGTVKSWLKKGKIFSDYTHPFGRSTLHFFDPDRISTIRSEMGLSEHTADTRKDDFWEFLEKKDYTFSYKIIFLLAFQKIQNARGEARLPELVSLYQEFYLRLLEKHDRIEKQNCPYNQVNYLRDTSALQRSLLQNPFEKFERKRFFRHCKDLNYIALDGVLLERFSDEDYGQIESRMIEDMREYFAKQNVEIQEDDYHFLLKKPVGMPKTRIRFIHNPSSEEKFKTILPFHDLSIAAGGFMRSEIPIEFDNWVQVAGTTARSSFDESMFVAQVQGKSMEPDIADGSYCLFTRNVGGSRNGRIVLAQHSDIVDQDTGASFTIKKYQSTKTANIETEWTHETITLKPANPDYDDILIPAENAGDFAIVAFFVEILDLYDN